MKDEIKEILFIEEQNSNYKILSKDVLIKLEDYITNLHEELEEEKRIEQADLDTINNLQDYKSRNDKAIEYVTYLGLKCKYRLNTGHLRKLRKILIGDEK